jgi:hypothetical protein
VNRTDWQKLADEKLLAAEALLAACQWASAYYLAGYAIECGLKSCVLAFVDATGVIFKEKKYSERCWTHKIEELIDLAGLKPDLDAAVAAAPALAANWTTACQWSEVARYKMNSPQEARSLYDAIVNPADGVMKWIRARW